MSATVYTCGDVQLDLDARVTYVSGSRVMLTFGEFEILRKFLAIPGRVFTRGELSIGTKAASERSVDVHILRLRKKLRSARLFSIETVLLVGYRGWAPPGVVAANGAGVAVNELRVAHRGGRERDERRVDRR